jgi:hypothetical protein
MHTNNSGEQPSVGLLKSLEDRLVWILVNDSRQFALAAQSPITAEIYLAALYRSFPDEISLYFRDPAPLAKLVKGLETIDVSSIEIAPAQSPGKPAQILNVKIDDALLRILREAGRLSAGAGRVRIGLADVMHALTKDVETTQHLSSARNLLVASTSTDSID